MSIIGSLKMLNSKKKPEFPAAGRTVHHSSGSSGSLFPPLILLTRNKIHPSIPAYDEGNEQWIVVFVHAFVILIGMVQNASRRATVSCKLFAKGPLITDIHLDNGWDRWVYFIAGQKNHGRKKAARRSRWVMYSAPCGRKLRNIDEVHRYLRIVKSTLEVDFFNFDWYLKGTKQPPCHCLQVTASRYF